MRKYILLLLFLISCESNTNNKILILKQKQKCDTVQRDTNEFIYTKSFLDTTTLLLEQVQYDFINNNYPISDSMRNEMAEKYADLVDIRIIAEKQSLSYEDKKLADSLFNGIESLIDTMLFMNNNKYILN